MKLIANADANWGIGCRGKLLVRIPEDMKFFREKTTGNTVILGRKTLAGFPGGRPLKERDNIILTRNRDFSAGDAVTVSSFDDLTGYLKDNRENLRGDLYVIGGESVYRMLLPYCDTAYITKLDRAYDADAFIPDLDKMDNWSVSEESEEESCFDITYRFLTYTNSEPRSIFN